MDFNRLFTPARGDVDIHIGLVLMRYDVTPPRLARKKTIFSLPLWKPRLQRRCAQRQQQRRHHVGFSHSPFIDRPTSAALCGVISVRSVGGGGQSVSVVLHWQPSDCIDLFVIDYIFLCYSQKINMMMMMMMMINQHFYAVRSYDQGWIYYWLLVMYRIFGRPDIRPGSGPANVRYSAEYLARYQKIPAAVNFVKLSIFPHTSE